MKKRTNLMIALLLNLSVCVFEVIGLIGTLRELQWGCFQYYTQDSNLIAMFSCGIMAVFQVQCLLGKRKRPARWATVLKYISVCLLSVTFLVVVFVLAPMSGSLAGYAAMLFRGTMLYYHFLCPVLAFLSFVFFEQEQALRNADVKLALIPTLIYAAVTTALNALRVMRGPYPFLMVYEQPVYASVLWFAVIVGGAYGIAYLTFRIKVKKSTLPQSGFDGRR